MVVLPIPMNSDQVLGKLSSAHSLGSISVPISNAIHVPAAFAGIPMPHREISANSGE